MFGHFRTTTSRLFEVVPYQWQLLYVCETTVSSRILVSVKRTYTLQTDSDLSHRHTYSTLADGRSSFVWSRRVIVTLSHCRQYDKHRRYECQRRIKDCMTSWVVLRHTRMDTLGGSLGGGSFVVKADINRNRMSADEYTHYSSNWSSRNRYQIFPEFEFSAYN